MCVCVYLCACEREYLFSVYVYHYLLKCCYVLQSNLVSVCLSVNIGLGENFNMFVCF